MMELPDDLREVEIQSTVDGSLEPSLVHCPEGVESAPLLVGLHTWSCDRFNQVEEMLPRCRERGWALVLPEFRGRNLVGNRGLPRRGDRDWPGRTSSTPWTTWWRGTRSTRVESSSWGEVAAATCRC